MDRHIHGARSAGPRRRAALIPLLVLFGSASAEYHSGFSLYHHTATADRIVEIEVPAEGQARLVSTLYQRRDGGLPELDAEVLRLRPDGATRAILFLRDGQPILGVTGVVWQAKAGMFLLPDNWSSGLFYPATYRDPTPDEFRRAVRTAAADREEVVRIATMRLGAERALAASRLLEKERPDVAWYVVDGFALNMHFDRDWSAPVPECATYLSELRIALADALGELTRAEAGALLERVAHLAPGALRREHIELVAGTEAASRAFDLLLSCHASATDIEEWVTTARAMRQADPKRADPLLFAEASVSKPELSYRLLALPAPTDPAALDLAARLGSDLLVTGGTSDGAGNLGHGVCQILESGRRPGDLPLLLAMARSTLSCRAQALVHLRKWTGETWEPADPRWDELARKH
jgi:hypothetical protein